MWSGEIELEQSTRENRTRNQVRERKRATTQNCRRTVDVGDQVRQNSNTERGRIEQEIR